ncbi:hypothetical protein [Trueperella abortisuis]|uniref:hypothetical protein n=1 Tax=Trueperella abortisuis TaxID=445930 RepID=UPI002893281E|nr:hypothetical protein [Trueperella abortisuis]
MIHPYEVTRGTWLNEHMLDTDGDGLTIDLDPLDPGQVVELQITLAGGRLAPTATIAVQDTVRPATLNANVFYPDPSLPVAIQVVGYTGRVYINITTGGEHTSPRRLALFAYAPFPEYQGAILDAVRLDQFTLPDPERTFNWFILDQSYLDRGVLVDEPSFYGWRNIIDHATSIDLSRGISYNGLTGKGETGTLTAQFYNALDPRASGLTRGTEIILSDIHTRRRLFTGTITSTTSTPDKDGTYTVTITAADRGYQLAQTQKYQDTRPSPASWESVAASLLKDHPTNITPASSRPLIGSVVKEATLTEYLDMLAATAGATWWISPTNVITVNPAPTSTPVAELIADTPAHTNLPGLNLSDADATLDWANIISHIEATNNEAARGAEGWENHTRTVRAASATNLASYGENRVSVETMAANPSELEQLLTGYMDAYTPAQVLRTATITPWSHHHHIRRDNELTTLIGLDIMDAVATSYRNETAVEHITRIAHHITPLTWQTTLELTQWRTK